LAPFRRCDASDEMEENDDNDGGPPTIDEEVHSRWMAVAVVVNHFQRTIGTFILNSANRHGCMLYL